jgi:hypothetical protein
MRRLLMLIPALILAAAPTGAVTWHIPQDYPTIQAAVDAAAPYDSILIEPGEYEGFFSFEGPPHLTILGSGAFSENTTSLYRSSQNPIHSCVWVQHVQGWEMGHFIIRQHMPQDASGIELWDADSCWVHHVDVMEVTNDQGMGLILGNSDNTTIERCLVRAGNYDVISMWYGPPNLNLTFRNLTVSGNGNGIINRSAQPNLHIVNCLTYQNSVAGIHIQFPQSSYIIQFNDSWANGGPEYNGFYPDSTNLTVNPLLVGGHMWWSFTPTANSPVIDAGDPDSPLDPDGTRADIGCIFFNQGPPGNHLSLALEPVNPPIIIPPEGGSFLYTTQAQDTSGWATFDAWGDLRQPDGQITNSFLVRSDIHLLAGQTLLRQLQAHLSSMALPGTYWLRAYLGDHPSQTVVAADSFSFVKEETGLSPGPYQPPYLTITGWDDPVRLELLAASAQPQELTLTASPNPFNPSTAIGYELRAASLVSLRVYDTAGRLVATLVEGWREPGTHEVVFDGSNLASGVYLNKLTAGDFTATEKMVLMK